MSDTEFSGPLFDGRAARAARDGTAAVRRRLASEAQKMVLANFQMAIRQHESGRFERSLTQTRVSRDYVTRGSGEKSYDLPVAVADTATDIVVTSDLATYGPWLEGTGSRNETTRFKGYHGFRLAAQQLDRSARSLAEAAFATYVDRMR